MTVDIWRVDLASIKKSKLGTFLESLLSQMELLYRTA